MNNNLRLKIIKKSNNYILWEPNSSLSYIINQFLFDSLTSEDGLISIPEDANESERDLMKKFLEVSNIPVIDAVDEVKTMIFHITWNCNLNCKYCYLDIENEDKSEMTLDEVISAITQFSDGGGLFLDVSGGEPLLREDLPIILKTGYDKALRVTLVTNGTLLNQDNIPFIKDYVDQISVSIDGFKNSNDALRGDGGFKKVNRTLDLLVRYSVPIGVTTVVTQDNEEGLLQLYHFLNDYNVQQWNLTLLRVTGRAQKSGLKAKKFFYLDDFMEKVSDNGHMDIVVDEFLLSPDLRRSLTKEYNWRDYARWHNTLTVLPNGDSVACVFFPKIVYGNVRREKIVDIYNSPIRRDVLSLKKPCDACPLSTE